MLSELHVPGIEAGLSLLVAGILIGVLSGSAGAWAATGGTEGEVSASDEVGARASAGGRG
jgi:hypothetical protein